MNTLLIAPPYSPFSPKEAAVPPLGLARIASIASEFGCVTVCDMGAAEASGEDGWDELLRHVASLEPAVIGIGPVVTSNRKKSLRVAKLMRRLFPMSKIVVGGPDPTFTYEEFFAADTGVDIVFVGEAERSFRELLECLDSKADWRRIKGIAYKSEAGVISSKPILLSRAELDELPIPGWRYFPLEKYKAIAGSINAKPYLPVETSRGCPLECVFCACSNLFEHKFRKRSAGSVISELDAISAQFGIDRFSLNDDNPSINSNHVRSLARSLAEQSYKRYELTFSATVDCDIFISADDMAMIREAGFLEVFMGCETPNPEVIAQTMKTKKPQEWPHQIKQAVEASRKAGIASRTSWILGLPLETPESFNKTIEFVRELRPDTALLSLLQPYPGTPLHELINNPENAFGLRYLSENPSSLIASKFEPVVETKYLRRKDTIELAYKFISELSPFFEANVSGSPYYLFELWRDKRSGKPN